MYRIREINPSSETEIALVASRMHQTLVEVLGEKKGTALYSMDWLLDRVRWHLDSEKRMAKIFLVEGESGEIVAHAIARIEGAEAGEKYGYFSTIFVEPRVRRKGLARRLLLHVESWFAGLELSKIVYNTAENHSALIQLFARQGYRITRRKSEMVELTKVLG